MKFGVQLGDVRKLAKKLKSNHDLAISLWETGNVDARLLAILLLKPKQLSSEELDRLVRSVEFVHVADWFNAYVIKDHPEREALRQRWMTDENPWAARAGWSLTAGQVARNPEGLALAIGETLGIYRDYPVSKGCTSPFAPIWTTRW